MWINHIYPLPPEPPASPSRLSQSTRLNSLCYIYSNLPLAVYFMYGNVYILITLSICSTFSFPCCIQNLFSVSASLSLPCKLGLLLKKKFFFLIWEGMKHNLTPQLLEEEHKILPLAVYFIPWLKWVEVAQSHSTLCHPMDYTVHGNLQARILEWVAFPFSRGSSQPRDRTQASLITGRFFTSWATWETQESWPRHQTKVSCIAGRFFTNWAIREAWFYSTVGHILAPLITRIPGDFIGGDETKSQFH